MKKLLILLFGLFLAGASIEDARKANEAYRSGDYAKAIELYKKAIDENPENTKLYYNLGNALAKDGNAEEAIRYFEQFKALSEDSEQRAMADYNIGNIHAEMEKWDKAVNSYKNSLRYKSIDEDAKHNYELALKKNEEQQQNQQQQQNSQDQQNNQNQDQNQQQQQQQQDQKQDQQQNQQQQQQQNDQQQQNQQQQQPKPNQISKAEAEKILKALEQKEKDLLKEFKKQKTESSNSTNEKDW